MSNNGDNARNLQLLGVSSIARARQESERFVRLSQLRKLSECEQVAAVCYRVRGSTIEFLLIKTRGAGRWTFPKGSAEPGLTHAQAAALEAFEEAGVHGRIEEISFASYRHRPINAKNRRSKSRERRVSVNAYLCEVLRLSIPQEAKRDRTWFSVDEARRRLREGRENGGGAGFARVVDKAVTRIRQLRSVGTVIARPQIKTRQERGAAPTDALQTVQFEFVELYGEATRLFRPHIRRQPSDTRLNAASVIDVYSREVLPCEILEFSRAREKKSKALGAGTKIG